MLFSFAISMKLHHAAPASARPVLIYLVVVFAFLDPEPTSKLGLLVGGGAVCVLSGGMTVIAILTRRRPPTMEIGSSGFKISWE
jgi:hypothetical protein